MEILPGRIQQWQSQPTVSEQFERRRLDQIDVQMNAAKQALDELAAQEESLDAWLAHVKQVEWDGRTEVGCHNGLVLIKETPFPIQEDNDEDESNNIYCPACGHETSSKNALRHISRCFSKVDY